MRLDVAQRQEGFADNNPVIILQNGNKEVTITTPSTPEDVVDVMNSFVQNRVFIRSLLD